MDVFKDSYVSYVKENQLSECRQADGGVSILDTLPHASGRPPDQVSTALNAERLRSADTVMGLIEPALRDCGGRACSKYHAVVSIYR